MAIYTFDLINNFHTFKGVFEANDLFMENLNSKTSNKLAVQTLKEVSTSIKNLETLVFIPGWMDFYLDNSLRMDIMTTVKGLEAGDNSIQLNCEDLPLGTYIVKFVSGKQTDNTKFIKM